MFDWAYLIPLAPFLMVLGIVYIKSREKLEEKRLSATAEASSEKAAQYATHIAKLEDRVQVLERIVTDRGYDIATQIEALRDVRQVESQADSQTPAEDSGIPLNLDKKETRA